MSRKNKKNGRRGASERDALRGARDAMFNPRLHPETRQSIWGIVCIGVSIIFILARIGKAGPAGESIYTFFQKLVGVGYFMLPLTLLFLGCMFLMARRDRLVGLAFGGALLLILSSLGLIHVVQDGSGGWLGAVLGSLKVPFGQIAGLVLNGVFFVVSLLIITNTPIKVPVFNFSSRTSAEDDEAADLPQTGESVEGDEDERRETKDMRREESEEEVPEEDAEPVVVDMTDARSKIKPGVLVARHVGNYVAPPLDLLKSSVEKPTTGDLRANANIIKRTLESFGVTVEMGEINIGPKVTRYTLKPAEGMKLSRITALSQDLALALAAHPIRIEAPIPGKSLVGVEVPNKAAAVVRLGSLLSYPEFQTAGNLGFVLGRDVNGEVIFSNIEKMPHLLVAGATGSGKSIFIHALITALLYKNSPETLRMVLIDPKRVELSMYEGIPHLAMPVIIDNKKAIGVFRWAVAEMERRYELLSSVGSRDVKSYNEKNKDNPLPFIMMIIDEMADMMSSYGREVEGLIIRLAQMSRATGIHLVLATQRPSVEIITGLIKANITNRVALQVASQVDSRTILDTGGAEKLLGGGDLLFISQEISKPRRIQGAYISEEEIAKVVEFVREHNKPDPTIQIALNDGASGGSNGSAIKDEVLDEYLEDGSDEMYDEAVEAVTAAKKASASLLQRRLKVGYARAARLLDLMEANGLIGPGDGAKPREVFSDQFPEQTQ
jgi:DNA segregation ATPase FtsK/SpoIIIE, S-DNA-T family